MNKNRQHEFKLKTELNIIAVIIIFVSRYRVFHLRVDLIINLYNFKSDIGRDMKEEMIQFIRLF